MDDAFLQTALSKMGENQLVSIKVMKNKFTGEPASYGFINFNSDHHALMAMHRLNGKVIPDSTPVSSKNTNSYYIYQYILCLFSINSLENLGFHKFIGKFTIP